MQIRLKANMYKPIAYIRSTLIVLKKDFICFFSNKRMSLIFITSIQSLEPSFMNNSLLKQSYQTVTEVFLSSKTKINIMVFILLFISLLLLMIQHYVIKIFNWNRFDLFDFFCLTPLSAIFQLYHGNQF